MRAFLLAPRGPSSVKSSAETRPFCAFDIEAHAAKEGAFGDQFSLACAVTSTGAVEHFDTREELQSWTEEWEGNAFAHSGGTYDFLFLQGKDEVLLTGSRILSARLGKARLKDTYPMMPMSLKKIGDAVGLHKLEVDRANLHRITREEERRYCEVDTRILVKALHQHRSFCLETVPHNSPSWPSTAGATAVYCAEAYEREAVRHMARHPLDPSVHLEHSGMVQGGRCELWQLGEVKGPVYAYDIKSSYPARYLEAPLPVGPWRPVSHEVHGVPAVWRVKFSQPRDRLPVLSSDGVFCHEGEGWATHEELYAARSLLGAKVEVLDGWVSARVLPLGQSFVRELYRLKESGSPFAKVCLNALHGKFGQRLLGGIYRRNGAGGFAFDEELSLPRWYQRPLVEAHILARARVALWKAMDALHRGGWSVLYTDTDSVHTNCPPERFAAVTGARMGKELGDWELKGTATAALYLAPKVYALRWDEATAAQVKAPTFVACKGFPASRVSWELLQQAWELPEEVPLLGVESWGTVRDDITTARDETRTLRAHPGAGKRRDLNAVWYAH